MYFGDYLVEKKIINSDQLLKALCFQIESLPSLVRLAWETNLVDSKEMLQIIKKQIKDESDILTVLKQTKNISNDKINELELLQMSKKMPLGEVVVKLQFAEISAINLALKDYYDNKFNIDESASVSSSTSEVEISEAALESLRELGMSIEELPTSVSVEPQTEEKPFIDQYLNLFSEKFKNKFKKLIEILNSEVNGTSDISNYYNSLYRDLHLLKGSMVLSELQGQASYVSIWESKIEIVLTKNNEEIRSWCKNNLLILDSFIELLWVGREEILKSKNDNNFITDSKNIEKFKNLINKIS